MCSLRPNESINITTFQYTLFSYVPNGSLFLGLFFSCPEEIVSSIPIRNIFNCSGDEDAGLNFFNDRPVPSEGRCARVIGVPVLRTAFSEFNRSETMPLVELLLQGFEMEYRVDGDGVCSRCQDSGGTCWSDLNSTGPSCICSDGIPRLVCPGSGLLLAQFSFISFYILFAVNPKQ